MPFFGSDWNDDNDWDDGPLGISSSMKEDLRREREEEENKLFGGLAQSGEQRPVEP